MNEPSPEYVQHVREKVRAAAARVRPTEEARRVEAVKVLAHYELCLLTLDDLIGELVEIAVKHPRPEVTE